ncbi:MAG TPA: HdeD family acid-resistance protein [Rubrobacter sp.]|nr:HdeD family acid-resistance protein [Rubrobacter sp.]
MSLTQPQPILPMVAGNWWALLLRGIAAVLFGLAALFWPGLTLYVLVIFFGAYVLVDGVFAIAAGIRGSGGRGWLLLAEGVLGVLAGLVALFWPGISALVLLYVIAAWAIFTGILKVVIAISLRREIENEWLMILSGVLSVVFGVVLAALPGVGLLSLVWLVGIYALIFGVALIVLGFRVRGHRRENSGEVS